MMLRTRDVVLSGVTLMVALGSGGLFPMAPGSPATASAQSEAAPTFKRDLSWPKPLPNNWAIGIDWGVSVGPNDHIWVVNQKAGQYTEQIRAAGKVPAPAILEFDEAGNLLQAWGEPGQGGWMQGRGRPFPAQAIAVDWEGNVWVTEESRGNAVVKFSPDGKFLLQIGDVNKTNGSGDTTLLGGPSGMDFDRDANEIYVADGYLNRRVIVFDAHTGAYKRHWGRYGKPPDDSFEPHPQPAWAGEGPTGSFPRFAHGVNVSHDHLVYAADRAHSRVQLFKADGTFVREAPTPGPINSVAFSADPGQYYLYGAGINRDSKIYIMRRSDFAVLGEFESSGQHYFAADSHGNLFTCGRDMPQKFVLTSCPRAKC